MNNSIDFSDFNKITVEHNSRCRKFIKHKFTIFNILCIIILIILIIVYINKDNKIKERKEILTNEDDKEILITQKLNILTNNLTSSEEKKTSISNQISLTDTYISKNQSYYNNLLLEIKNLKEQKIPALKSQIEDLEEQIEESEITKLQNQIKERTDIKRLIVTRLLDLTKSNSNFNIKFNQFESQTSSEILKRCYDSVVYKFDPEKYHSNCDGGPLLILIKTKSGQNIGAYVTKSIGGNNDLQDEESLLINFDTYKFYSFNKNNAPIEYPIYCNPNSFTRFGEDLIIYNNGKGQSKFPHCYGIGEGNEGDFVEESNFEIDILEVYKLNIYKNI